MGVDEPAAAGIDRFTPFGPMSGDLAAVAIDPRLPAHLLLATATTGLYESTDGGHAWGVVPNGLRQERLLATAFDPANPGSVYGIGSTAAFHSADGGRSWAIAGSGDFAPPPGVAPVGPAPARLVLLSGDPGALPTLLVGVGSHLLRSADGGQTWTPVPNLPVRFEQGVLALTVVPTRPATIYAATDAGLFASGDAGATWRRVAILASPDPLIVTGLAFEPGNPSVLYAADFENLFVSTDAGVTWTRRTGLLQAEILSLVPVSGTRTIYSLTENALEVSFDRGRHWAIAVLSGAGSNLVRLRFQPGTPSTIYAVEGGGAFESRDGGRTWTTTLPCHFGDPSLDSVRIDRLLQSQLTEP